MHGRLPMKVTIRDSQILKTIEPGKLAEHLRQLAGIKTVRSMKIALSGSKTTLVNPLKFSYHSNLT
jgi:hypothetical protein